MKWEIKEGWEAIECSCCNGFLWGRDYPCECTKCEGSGRLWKHKKSGAIALYPGGPFRGRLLKSEV